MGTLYIIHRLHKRVGLAGLRLCPQKSLLARLVLVWDIRDPQDHHRSENPLGGFLVLTTGCTQTYDYSERIRQNQQCK